MTRSNVPASAAVHPLIARLAAEPQRWRLRPAAATDDGDVAAFLTAGFLHPFVHSVTLRFLRWLLRDNPEGQGIGWIADVDGRLVAYGSWLPCRVRWQGNDVRAFKIGPLCVATEWRNQGLFLHLTDTCLRGILSPERPFALSLGSVGPVSNGLCRFLGCRATLELVEHVLPLRAEAVRDTQLPRFARSAALKSLGARAVRLGATVAATSLGAIGGRGVHVRVGGTTEAGLDDFLRAAIQGYAWSIARDTYYLGWRYGSNPRHPYRFYVARRGQEACGYMVLNVNHDHEGIIIDLFTAIGDGGAYRALLAAAVRQFLAGGVQSIRMYQHPGYWANPLVRRILPVVRTHPLSLVVCSLDGSVGASASDRGHAWHVCLGDTDDEGGLDQISPPAPERSEPAPTRKASRGPL